MTKQKSLKQRVNHIFFVSIGIPFVLSIILHGVFVENLIFNNYRNTTRLTLESMANHINSYIDSCEKFFLQYLFDDNLQRFYAYVNNYEIIPDNSSTYYNYFRRAVKYHDTLIKYMVASNLDLRRVGFIPVDENENRIFLLERSVGNVELMDVKGSSYESLLEKARGLKLGEILISAQTIRKDPDEQTFTLVRKVNQVEKAQLQGYVFAEASADIFEEIVSDINLEENAGVVISYPDGNEAYSSSGEIRELYHEIDDVGTAREEIRIRTGGERYCLYSVRSDSGFYIDYLVPETAIDRQVWKLYGLVMGVWAAAVFVAFVLYTRLFGKIGRTTAEIVDLTEHYQLDDMEKEPRYCEVSGITEFDSIGETLVNMMKRIKSFAEKEYILKLNQQVAEYKAMQTEINPHFINNVLSSFIALNRMHDQERLEKAILRLSQMFRYTCEHSYESRLGTEFWFIGSYLELEKIRFEDRLDYTVLIEPEAEDFQIPKLLVQPLVENAMKHGFDGEHPVTIRLEAAVLTDNGMDFIWIIVANSGRPIEKGALERSSGVGLKNVRERLRLVYPDSFMWFSCNEQFPTICNILICRNKKEEPGEAERSGHEYTNR